ncbi:hypothetical protein [Citreimonas salinaria]|uniref:Uncharacterized protein n=1 Tax=Citreimonas salinaria TaxID=321339 RepID=A0A1H3KSM4_9RHOB|nr:hypothetical protein [Citreimonas salinaria]SDY55026.1 hypothetical protein SAMN05444340_11079 [Citreimonas salinaria]
MTSTPAIRYPRHPANLDPFVEMLGPALTVEFLLKFGGSTIYFPNDPKGKSEAEALVGPLRLKALGKRLPHDRARVPTARGWVAHALRAEGRSVAEIARLCGRSDVQVRSYLKSSPHGASHPAEAPESRQLRLF